MALELQSITTMPTPADLRRTLQPERALLRWSWLAALLLLALNDHWLKHVGLLPGWFTGKLSDFAGLYLAPALLAALVRARSEAALLACHAAVLAVFSAINLDPGCAALLASAMGWLGFDWRIVTDAEDLIALPALLGSWFWLRPAMRPAAATRAQRFAQHACAAVGLLFCMATSDGSNGPWGLFAQGPHLHNSSSAEIIVLVRPLKGTVQLDCNAIGEAPGSRIPDAAFGVAEAFRIEPRGNIALESEWGGRCAAVSISGSGLQPAIVFWRASDDLTEDIPSEYQSEEEWDDGAVVLLFEDGRHNGYRSVGGDFVFEIERRTPELGEACAPADEGARPAASSDLPTGRVRLLAVDEGPDGCVALHTTRAESNEPSPIDDPGDDPGEDAGIADGEDAGVVDVPDPGGEPIDPGTPTGTPAYVCLPPGMFPFQAGDVVTISLAADEADPSRGRALTIRETDADGLPLVELFVASIGPAGFIAGLDLSTIPRRNCDYVLNEQCAQTTAPTDVRVSNSGDDITVSPGAPPASIALRDRVVELAVPLSQERILVDTECAGGADAAGFDSVVVAVIRWEGAE
jgi:hypothetical protein